MKYMAPHSPILEPEKNREGICEQHRTIFSIGAFFYSDFVFFQIFIPIVLFFPLVLGLPPVHYVYSCGECDDCSMLYFCFAF